MKNDMTQEEFNKLSPLKKAKYIESMEEYFIAFPKVNVKSEKMIHHLLEELTSRYRRIETLQNDLKSEVSKTTSKITEIKKECEDLFADIGPKEFYDFCRKNWEMELKYSDAAFREGRLNDTGRFNYTFLPVLNSHIEEMGVE